MVRRLAPVDRSCAAYEWHGDAQRVLVGRHPACQVVVDDTTVSLHQFSITGNTLEALCASGCLINDILLKPKSPRNVKFDVGSTGLTVSEETGEVRQISPGSQAERLGIRKGWQIVKVDDKPFSKGILSVSRLNLEALEAETSITFMFEEDLTWRLHHKDRVSIQTFADSGDVERMPLVTFIFEQEHRSHVCQPLTTTPSLLSLGDPHFRTDVDNRYIQIGRDALGHVKVSKSHVCSKHLRIRDELGSCSLEQLSEHGCFVNEHFVGMGCIQELRQDCVITLCKHKGEFRPNPAYFFQMPASQNLDPQTEPVCYRCKPALPVSQAHPLLEVRGSSSLTLTVAETSKLAAVASVCTPTLLEATCAGLGNASKPAHPHAENERRRSRSPPAAWPRPLYGCPAPTLDLIAEDSLPTESSSQNLLPLLEQTSSSLDTLDLDADTL